MLRAVQEERTHEGRLLVEPRKCQQQVEEKQTQEVQARTQEIQQQGNHSNDCTVAKFRQEQAKEEEERHERKENSDSNEDLTTNDKAGFLIRRMPEINVSSSSDEDYSTSVQLEQCYTNERPNKRLKPTPQSTEIVGEIKNREGDVRPIRVLLDTGTSYHYLPLWSPRLFF